MAQIHHDISYYQDLAVFVLFIFSSFCIHRNKLIACPTMKNQIYGLWDVYSMNYVLYRKYTCVIVLIFYYDYTELSYIQVLVWLYKIVNLET